MIATILLLVSLADVLRGAYYTAPTPTIEWSTSTGIAEMLSLSGPTSLTFWTGGSETCRVVPASGGYIYNRAERLRAVSCEDYRKETQSVYTAACWLMDPCSR